MIFIKIVLAGGGTAGHVTPNLALIPALREAGFSEIHYIGTKGIEKELVQKENIPFHEITAGKLRRYLDMENLKDIGRILKGVGQAKKILKQLQPQAVFSKGGFASCPVVWAAKRLHIPVLLHESDITPGLANKLCLPCATKICYAFPETRLHLPAEKAVYTGIPIRRNLFTGSKAKGLSVLGFTGEKPVLTVIGGSQGSAFLNQIVRESLPDLQKSFDVCHLCGKNNINTALLHTAGYKQFEYLHAELYDVMQATDLFVSRAGATTIFEILALKKPALLVPLIKGSRGDQILNAASFEKQGYACKTDETELTTARFSEAVFNTYQNRSALHAAMQNADAADSAQKIITVLQEIIE